MVYSIKEIKRRVRPVAEKYQIPEMYLFGSYARGEANDNSDIDIIYQLTGSNIRGLAYGGVYSDLEEALGKELSLIEFENFVDEPDALFQANIDSEKVKIYG